MTDRPIWDRVEEDRSQEEGPEEHPEEAEKGNGTRVTERGRTWPATDSEPQGL